MRSMGEKKDCSINTARKGYQHIKKCKSIKNQLVVDWGLQYQEEKF